MQRVGRLSTTTVAAAAKRSRAIEASSMPRAFFSAQPWSDSHHEKEDHGDPQQHKHEEPTESERFAREFPKPRMDATFLVNNYTAPALAAAYQDR